MNLYPVIESLTGQGIDVRRLYRERKGAVPHPGSPRNPTFGV